MTTKAKNVSVTWLGDGSDAQENEWNGRTFKVGEPVELHSERDRVMVEKAKANRFFKVEGDDSPTIEDQPLPPPPQGRDDDLPENIAFAPQERLDAHREASMQRARLGDIVAEQETTSPKVTPEERAEIGGSVTLAEREAETRRRSSSKSRPRRAATRGRASAEPATA